MMLELEVKLTYLETMFLYMYTHTQLDGLFVFLFYTAFFLRSFIQLFVCLSWVTGYPTQILSSPFFSYGKQSGQG